MHSMRNRVSFRIPIAVPNVLIDYNLWPTKNGIIVGASTLSYRGSQIDQSFTKLIIQNYTSGNLIFSPEIGNDVVVSTTAGDGCTTLAKGQRWGEDLQNYPYSRLRFFVTGVGFVEVILNSI